MTAPAAPRTRLATSSPRSAPRLLDAAEAIHAADARAPDLVEPVLDALARLRVDVDHAALAGSDPQVLRLAQEGEQQHVPGPLELAGGLAVQISIEKATHLGAV